MVRVGRSYRFPSAAPRAPAASAHAAPVFDTSHNCIACHNGLTTPSGVDISFGVAWRATMMANSARDPYWLAAVRRETIDYPSAVHEIEDELPSPGPFMVEIELRYQPIAFRWAENFKTYDAPEPRRFVGYFRSMSAASSAVLARGSVTVR